MKKRMMDPSDAMLIMQRVRSESIVVDAGFVMRNSIPYSSVARGKNAKKTNPLVEPIFSYTFMGSGWYFHSFGDMMFAVQLSIFVFSA